MAARRAAMVEDGVVGWGIQDPIVIDALRTVPRHLFVPDEYLDQAYENHPLPIGFVQTISQPYIVALMTEALGIEPGDRVLEIGTGSGYQAAVLAEVGAEDYTVEIIEPLAEAAAERLERLRYDAIETRAADGYYGWPEAAPYRGDHRHRRAGSRPPNRCWGSWRRAASWSSRSDRSGASRSCGVSPAGPPMHLAAVVAVVPGVT